MAWKTFAAELLTAADVNTYLMSQAIIRVADIPERSQIPALEPGITVYRANLPGFETWNGTRWAPWRERMVLDRTSSGSVANNQFVTISGFTIDTALTTEGFGFDAGDATFPDDGPWLIRAHIEFAANATGRRELLIGSTRVAAHQAAPGSATIVNGFRVVTGSSLAGLIRVRQTSGSSINVDSGQVLITRAD